MSVLPDPSDRPIASWFVTIAISAVAVLVALPGAVLDVADLIHRFDALPVGLGGLVALLIVVIIVQELRK